ncbi:DNA-binding protein [uncultured Pseudacidovorax sp.]|uniref:DNA-binding protein n=1 Tax=uncultured Pseudacidovorax sp. TaxID=679313 RepID=UPI0025FE7E60|nr:DNA-binding protein [uncultured Pseudacidovorax sp.]
MALKTRAQIRAEFARRGQSYTGWAKQRGYTPNTVIAICNDNDKNPRLKCTRGEAHNIAVELGLKEGEVSHAPTLRLAAA